MIRITEGVRGRHQLDVDRSIAEDIWARSHEVSTGVGAVESLDSHANLVRFKIAGLLAVLDGRQAMTIDDWRLAGMVQQTSNAVRASAIAHLASERRKREAEANARAVRREAAIDGSKEGRALASGAKAMARVVHRAGTPLPRANLTRAMSGQQRKLVTPDQAIEYAIEKNWLRCCGDGFEPGESAPT
jgi:hypothetical protein